jgi:hypothetical protein
MRLVVALGVGVSLAAGCGAGSDIGALRSAPTEATPDGGAVRTAGPNGDGNLPEGPGAFRLEYDDDVLVLWPSTWCYSGGCVDGYDPHPVSVGGPAEIRVHVAVSGWSLTASFKPTGERCGRDHAVTPEPVGDDWFVLRPAGHADDYTVNLFAQGGGDMSASFRWVTPVDGVPRVQRPG